MSKILIIEPYRMLQLAFSTALFADHEVQTMESFPGEPPHPLDLIIIDATSLRAKNLVGHEPPRWLQDGNVPIVWVDDQDPTDAPKREKLIVVQSPLTKDRLLAAVAHCLSLLSKPHDNASLGDATRGSSLDTVARSENAQVIDLVDVIDEEPESKESESDRKQ